MLQSDREALHYSVVADTARKVEKVANELATLYRASYFNKERVELRKKHLEQYFNELSGYLDYLEK